MICHSGRHHSAPKTEVEIRRVQCSLYARRRIFAETERWRIYIISFNLISRIGMLYNTALNRSIVSENVWVVSTSSVVAVAAASSLQSEHAKVNILQEKNNERRSEAVACHNLSWFRTFCMQRIINNLYDACCSCLKYTSFILIEYYSFTPDEFSYRQRNLGKVI